MLVLLVLVNLILFQVSHSDEDGSSDGNSEFGAELITSLRNDVNLDLSVDEEYEDLRAELLAYHTALASLTSNRRSMMTTPCWSLGGICVDYKLCTGFRFLSEVPGCKDRLNVCCFAWNRFNVRDMTDKGFKTLALPWSHVKEFGGQGVLDIEKHEKKKKRKKNRNKTEAIAVILRTNK